NESGARQSSSGRAVSQPQNRRESCCIDRSEGCRRRAISWRTAGHRHLRSPDRRNRLTNRRGDEIMMWEAMFWPIAACVLLPWLLVYLGLHVVQRGIIFIDIAMAQMASLGICIALLIGYEPENLMTYVIGLGVTL